MRQVLILGGYGNVGFQVAKHLLDKATGIKIILAGRDLHKAEAAAKQLDSEFPGQLISGIKLDASDYEMVVKALSGVDLMVVASSTLKYVNTIAEAALQAGVDYLDTQLSSPDKLEVLYGLKDRILHSKRIFITDGGFHPGIPAVLVRWAENQIGPLQIANVFGALRLNWAELKFSKGTGLEMVEEFKYFEPTVWRNGKWDNLGFTEVRRFNFEEPFYRKDCSAMMIEEIKWLVEEIPSLRETGFYVTGFNRVLDYFLLPIILLGVKWFPRRLSGLLAMLFRFGLRFSNPPFGVKLVASCEGPENQLQISLFHLDGYQLTAAPIVACILQYLDGSVSPGLWLQSFAVEPERFLKDIKNMGISVKVLKSSETTSSPFVL